MRIVALLVVASAVTGFAFAQDTPISNRPFLSIESVDLGGGSLFSIDRTPGFWKANGYLTGAEVRGHMNDWLYLGLSGGYGKMSVQETDPITLWNWPYWNRLYRNYIVLWLGSDSAYNEGRLKSLRAISNTSLTTGRWTGKDSIYSVQLTPVQYMNVYPIRVTLGLRLPPIDRVQMSGSVSLVVMPFERNLYLDESWTKRRKVDVGTDSGSYYTFAYSYRNFANSRRGTAWGAEFSLEYTYELGAGFAVFGTWRMIKLFPGLSPESYAVLPVQRFVSFGSGVRVRY